MNKTGCFEDGSWYIGSWYIDSWYSSWYIGSVVMWLMWSWIVGRLGLGLSTDGCVYFVLV
jgi:hypothetical protein